MILKLRSSEFEDHRVIRVNSDWIKFYYQHEHGITHIVVGDGYQSDQFPIECVPVLESVEEIDSLLGIAGGWEGRDRATDS